MPLNPTPQRKQIFQFPTPNLDDRVFYELHDATLMSYTVPEYGTPHPNQSKYAGYVFAHVRSANDSGWVMWFYLNERANQDEYNYEITYPYADTAYPAYVRTYVLKREGMVEPLAGSDDPVLGAEYILTAHKQTRLGDPVLDSLFVGVQRAYEKLPGPIIESTSINSRGDLQTKYEQAVPAGTSLEPDSLTVMQSAVEYESTVKGRRVYSSVSTAGHATLTGRSHIEAYDGVEGTSTSQIVDPTTAIPALGTNDGGYVIAATATPISASKSELKVVKVAELPTTEKTFYNDRGELETETTEFVVHSPSVVPAADSLLTTKSLYIQDSIGFGRKVKSEVAAYEELTTTTKSAEYKGAVVTESLQIVAPGTAVPSIGNGVGSTTVAATLVQKSTTKAIKKVVTIDGWPVLYDYNWDAELSKWVEIKYEIVPAVSTVPASPPAAFTDIEYKAIDKNWTSKITRTVQDVVNNKVNRSESQDVPYDFPSIFYGVNVNSVANKAKRGFFFVKPRVASGFRRFVKATVYIEYNDVPNPASIDGHSTTPTDIIPVNVSYNGVLFSFDAGRCLVYAAGSVNANTASDDPYWGLKVETYAYPASVPMGGMPAEVTLPLRSRPWKYSLYRHELAILNTNIAYADPT